MWWFHERDLCRMVYPGRCVHSPLQRFIVNKWSIPVPYDVMEMQYVHCTIWFKSCCENNAWWSSGDLMQPSANKQTDETILLLMSYKVKASCRGTSTVSWGTPDMTFASFDATPSTKLFGFYWWAKLISSEMHSPECHNMLAYQIFSYARQCQML